VRDKKKKRYVLEEQTALAEENREEDTEALDNTKLGVDDVLQNDDETVDNVDPGIPSELESDLGPYWALANSCQAYVLNTITSYSNIEASKSTPQYGFNRGLKEFGELGYEATLKELDDNLLGMGAIKMLKPSEVNKNIRYEALNYLIFLKRKKMWQD
jgi:hypothetical protein